MNIICPNCKQDLLQQWADYFYGRCMNCIDILINNSSLIHENNPFLALVSEKDDSDE